MATAYSGYSVAFDSTVIDDIISQSETPGIELANERAGGAVDIEFQSVSKGEPRIKFVTRQIGDALGLMDSAQAYLCKDLAALTTGLIVTYQKRAQGGIFTSGSNHLKGTLADGMACWNRITAEEFRDAEIEIEAVGVHSTGLANPYSVSASQALPTRGAIDSRYRIGPLTINNVAMGSLSRVEIRQELELEILYKGGAIFPTLVCIRSRKVMFTFQGVDVGLLAASGAIGASGTVSDQANMKFYLRKQSQNGLYVADATAEHISFSAAGIALGIGTDALYELIPYGIRADDFSKDDRSIREELGLKNRRRTHEARAQKPATKSRGEGTMFKTNLHADE
jgi:hypothetical protein